MMITMQCGTKNRNFGKRELLVLPQAQDAATRLSWGTDHVVQVDLCARAEQMLDHSLLRRLLPYQVRAVRTQIHPKAPAGGEEGARVSAHGNLLDD
mmetsp:Transcript_8426/g.18090  ORF Transcript_8426/g.18090 Transcript_8426/m.18090 type:complete len:96 (+) Transcript_8426:575-862(+)